MMNNDLPPIVIVRIEAVLPQLEPGMALPADRLAEIVLEALNPPSPLPSPEKEHQITPMPETKAEKKTGNEGPAGQGPAAPQPAHSKDARVFLVEKLLNLVPLKTVFPKAHQEQKSKNVHETLNQIAPNKGVSIAKGETVASDKKEVAEEIEATARSQSENRIFHSSAYLKNPEKASETPMPLPQIQKGDSTPILLKKEFLREHSDQKGSTGISEKGVPSSQSIRSETDPNVQLRYFYAGIQQPQTTPTRPSENRTPETLQAKGNGDFSKINPSIPYPAMPPFDPGVPKQPVIPPVIPQDFVTHVERTARPDAITAIDKNTLGVPLVAIPIKPDDRDIVRIPLLPDKPIAQESYFKYKGKEHYKKLLEDEGHRLDDVVFMVLCAVLCGAKSVTEVWSYLQARQEYFSMWLGLKSGLPTFRMLAFVLGTVFPQRMQALLKQQEGMPRLWESDRGLILGQLYNEAEQSLEKALTHFDCKGALVRIDAPQLHSSLSKKLHDQEADYVVALHGSQGTAFDQALEFFEATLPENPAHPKDVFREVIQEFAHVEQREILLTNDLSWLTARGEWTALSTALKFSTELVSKESTFTNKRMYLSSLSLNARGFSGVLRTLPALERRAAWLVDIDFSQWTVDHTQANFEQIRLYSWDLLTHFDGDHATPEARRKKAAENPAYLRQILATK